MRNRSPQPHTIYGPQLVPRLSPEKHSLLELWHLCSLDAPSVATLWTVTAARSAGVVVALPDVLAMFTAVWMLYAIDRLLDAAPLGGVADTLLLETRHRFHHEHRSVIAPLLVVAACLLATLVVHIPSDELRLYSSLALLLVGWLLLVHGLAGERAQRLPKELAVGVFFPLAVFIPAWVRAPAAHRLLPLSIGCFAAVCTLNCLLLYAWEHPKRPPQAHVSTRAALRILAPLCIGTLALQVALSVSIAAAPDGFRALAHPLWVPISCALTSSLLLVLHYQRSRISRLRLRALADLTLLTPGLMFLGHFLFQGRS